MTKTKKTFKDSINPAMSFISQESVHNTEGQKPAVTELKRSAKSPEGYKLNPLYIETKSVRLQLLIQPSLKAKLKEKAQAEGTSVNDLVNCLLWDALAEEE